MKSSTYRILILEAHAQNNFCLATLLAENTPQDLEFELVSANNLVQALALAKNEHFDLILLDLTIDECRSASTIAIFRRAAPAIPILAIWDSEEDDVAIEAVRAGAQDCLLKSSLAGHWLRRAIRHAIERQNLEDELRRSQKMQAVGQLVGGIAHDFNNMLQVIIGRAQLAIERLPPGDNTSLCDLTLIRQTGQRAAVMTQQLLAFSRKQVLRPELLDLNALVIALAPMLQGVLPSTLTLELNLDPTTRTILADRGQLEQVLLNLVVNARDAMPNGGQLSINTENVWSIPTITRDRSHKQLSVRDSGSQKTRTKFERTYTQLTVRDTGCGMDSTTISRVFEPYFTTKRNGKGTGLGLAMVYGIVRQSNGHIQIDSEPNKGTTVKIYLPHEEGIIRSVASSRLLPRVDQGAQTILLAEDDDAVRELIGELLQGAGYSVLLCHNGTHALETCQRYKGEIDLLISDIVMPGMNGIELAKSIRRLRPRISELYISGYMGCDKTEQEIVDQCTVRLQKPFSANELIQKVRDTIGSRSVST